jgi:hypothetical protein
VAKTKRLKGRPSVRELAALLAAVKRDVRAEADDGEGVEVRLQVVDGSWELHTGDPCYDTDHRGYWGAGTLTPDTNCRELAAELIDEAEDDHAAAG